MRNENTREFWKLCFEKTNEGLYTLYLMKAFGYGKGIKIKISTQADKYVSWLPTFKNNKFRKVGISVFMSWEEKHELQIEIPSNLLRPIYNSPIKWI